MPEMKYIPLEQLIEPPNPMRLAMDDEKMTERRKVYFRI